MTRSLTVLTCILSLAACGDSGSGAGGGGGTPPSGGSPPVGGEGGGPPAESCIQPGDMGNELGVGEYCSPLGGQCMDNSDAQLCLADVGQDQWMCSRIGCTATTDCGEGAGCLITDDGSACVPCMCESTGIGCGEGGAPTGGAPTGGAPTGGAGGA